MIGTALNADASRVNATGAKMRLLYMVWLKDLEILDLH